MKTYSTNVIGVICFHNFFDIGVSITIDKSDFTAASFVSGVVQRELFMTSALYSAFA